jgi:hypothetical protein
MAVAAPVTVKARAMVLVRVIPRDQRMMDLRTMVLKVVTKMTTGQKAMALKVAATMTKVTTIQVDITAANPNVVITKHHLSLL